MIRLNELSKPFGGLMPINGISFQLEKKNSFIIFDPIAWAFIDSSKRCLWDRVLLSECGSVPE
jgi:hypothetical protein